MLSVKPRIVKQIRDIKCNIHCSKTAAHGYKDREDSEGK
jgi:hypothetical protein